jgi:poly-gamma-glutamate synthesis protein (capsule biosynthesis protein)
MKSKKSERILKIVHAFCMACLIFTAICAVYSLVYLLFFSHNQDQTSTSDETAEKQQEEEPESRPYGQATISFTGDILLETGLAQGLDNYNVADYVSQVSDLMEADLCIGQLETVIGGEELGLSTSGLNFNAPDAFGISLVNDTPFNFFTTANNHSLDRSTEGILHQTNLLDELGVGHTGTFVSEEDYYNIRTVEINGITVSILAYTYGTNQSRTNWYDAGYYLQPYTFAFSDWYKETIASQIQQAKEISDFVIVAAHWGKEFTYTPNDTEELFINFLVDQEVDLIIGNHPHNIQSADVIEHEDGNTTYLIRSLGNFMSSAANVDRADEQFKNMYEIGAIGRVDLQKDEETGKVSITNASITPIVNHFEEGYTNFALIPLSEYTDELASKHYQALYSSNFTLDYLKSQVHEVFDASGLLNLDN